MAHATIASEVCLSGQGLHSGIETRLEIHPADEGEGIVFERIDLPADNNRIEAHYRNVRSTRLCTMIGNGVASVQTIEHLMASLAACGISNARILVDGPEIPAADGSALPFARLILEAGVEWQHQPRKVIKVLREVGVDECGDDARARLVPASCFEMELTIEFPDPVGIQNKSLCLSNGAIANVLGNSRTFCAMKDVPWMQSRGFGLGGNHDNVVVIDFDSEQYLSEPRHVDECVRHKMLDAVGDLSLAGMPILGRFIGHKSGHTANWMLLRELFSNPSNFEILVADSKISSSLPGVELDISTLSSIH